MGNCQAIDAATLVIQHPNGKSDTMFWPVSANEIMKMNPGHYVALLITSTLYPSPETAAGSGAGAGADGNSVRITRIKLLRSTDTLVLGQVYRLITTQEVMKSLVAKKHAKLKNQLESSSSSSSAKTERVESRPDTASRRRSGPERSNQLTKQEQKQRTSKPANPRSKTWHPSLNSISEATN